MGIRKAKSYKTDEMKNPTVSLKLNGKDYLKIDLWTLIRVYAPKEAMLNHNSLTLFLNKEMVGKAGYLTGQVIKPPIQKAVRSTRPLGNGGKEEVRVKKSQQKEKG